MQMVDSTLSIATYIIILKNCEKYMKYSSIFFVNNI